MISSAAVMMLVVGLITVLLWLHPTHCAHHIYDSATVRTHGKGKRIEKFSFNPESRVIADFSHQEKFQFGIATAPAHVEDRLDDSWAEWARAGRIPFNNGTWRDLDRLRFWSDPRREIELAASLGVKLFRFGIDWGRLQPYRPGSNFCSLGGYSVQQHEYHDQFHGSSSSGVSGSSGGVSGSRGQSSGNYNRQSAGDANQPTRPSFERYSSQIPRWPCRGGVQNMQALKRYQAIIGMIKQSGMRPHLTLFHHSLPRWANDREFKGWLNEKTIQYFVGYVEDLIPHLATVVEDFVVFNEPAVFASLVYGMAMWPGRLRDQPDYFSVIFDTPIYKSAVYKAFHNMAEAHRQAYQSIHLVYKQKMLNRPKVGVAHNIAFYQPSNILLKPLAMFMDKLMNWDFMDLIAPQWVDFIGLNYYGAEYVSITGSAILSDKEYSESGRSVWPDGLYQLLMEFHRRYNIAPRAETDLPQLMSKEIPFLITENGVSDETDILRPAYLIEHLLAVRKAMEKGVPVEGFVFWTVSDNWEWTDGYCPHFGLFAVDRRTDELRRIARPSAYLYKSICETGSITLEQRMDAWSLILSHAGQQRPFCRAADGRATVNQTSFRRFLGDDSWRFQLLTADGDNSDDDDDDAYEGYAMADKWAEKWYS